MFADDVVLVCNGLEKLRELFGAVVAFCDDVGLTVSNTKTELLIAGKRGGGNNLPARVCLHERYSVACCREFRYLGICFDQEASSKSMIASTLQKGRRAFMWLLKFVQD